MWAAACAGFKLNKGGPPVLKGRFVGKGKSWIAGLVVSGAALIITFWGVQPQRVLQVISRADALYMIPAGFMIFLGLLARARSWHVLMAERAPYRRVFWALNEGYLLNNVLPLRLGEIGRAYAVSQGQPVSTAAALATVVVERLIDVAVSLAGLTFAISAMAAPAWAGQIIQVAAGVLVGLLLISGVLVLSKGNIMRLVDILPGAGWAKMLKTVDDFAQGLSEASRPTRLLRSGGWSLLAWVTAWVSLDLMIRMFGMSSSPVILVFVTGVTAFGAALPSSPGAVGVYELSTVAALLVFGYPQAMAVGLAILAHALSLIITGGLGAIGLAREGRTIMGLASQAQRFFKHSQETLAV